MQNLTEIAQHVSTELLDLATAIEAETTTHPKGLADIQVAQLRRGVLKERLSKLREETSVFVRTMDRLRLPSPSLMVWARSILDLDNAAILEIDTTSIDYAADVIRVLLLSTDGDVLFDRMLRPASLNSNQEHTGITPETLAQAQPIEEVWKEVMMYLKDHYLVSFGMEFDADHIAAQNQRLNGAPYRLFTEDLQRNMTDYFQRGYYTKLEDVAATIGHTMPEKPQRDALDRAKATLAALRAVADGFIKAATGEGDEFPF
jgi:DNA polymerase III epsilon subunit-like protein